VCCLASIALGLLGSSVVAQDRKGVRFWHLTLYTITTFQMSSVGKGSWSPEQCKNDRDRMIDHDERLRITNIERGRSDVKLDGKIGRVCIVRRRRGEGWCVFSIEERQLTDRRRLCPSSTENSPLAAGQRAGRPYSRCGSAIRPSIPKAAANWDQAASAPRCLGNWVVNRWRTDGSARVSRTAA
jgi:hypothetical protein